MSTEVRFNDIGITGEGREYKSKVQTFLWSRMGNQVRAISTDAVGFRYMREGNSWLVLTGERDPSFLNMGYVEPSRNHDDVKQLFHEALSADLLPAELFTQDTPPDESEDKHPVPHMIKILSTEVSADDQIQLPEGYSFIQVTTDDELVKVVASQANAFEVNENALSRTMGPKLLAHPDVKTFAIEDVNGSIVSSCMMVSTDGVIAGLWNMVTLQSHQNNGLGKLLLAHATTAMRETGVKIIQLYPSDSNSERFYTRHGFTTYSVGAEETIEPLVSVSPTC